MLVRSLRLFAIFCALCVFGGAASAVIPTISGTSAELQLGPAGTKPSIAADKEGYAHIVVLKFDGSGNWYFYDQTATGWKPRYDFFLSNHHSPAGSFNNPHMEIELNGDRSWISGVMVIPGNYAGTGMGIVQRSNMSTDPNATVRFSYRLLGLSPPAWPIGNASVDQDGSCVAWSNFGKWERLAFTNGAITKIGSDSALFKGKNLGERPCNNFRVSTAPALLHPGGGGTKRVWHVSYFGNRSLSAVAFHGYNNSYREALGFNNPVEWGDPNLMAYEGRDDDNYSGTGIDAKNPLAAYMSVDSREGTLQINIWNGTNLLYNKFNLLEVNGTDGNWLRWGQQWAPAKDGGSWLTWEKDGKVMLRYFGLDGAHGNIITVCDGVQPTCGVDPLGNVHLAYFRSSKTCYRKVSIASFAQISPKGNVTNQTPTFVWTDTSTTSGVYTIKCSNTVAVTQVFQTNSVGTNRSLVCPTNLDLGHYAWIINRSVGATTSRLGPLAFDVIPDTPGLIYPVGGEVIAEPEDITFAWAAVSNADRYLLEIRNSNSVYTTDVLAGSASTNWTPADASNWAGGPYTWRITPSNNLFQIGGVPSAYASFSLSGPEAPTILAPTAGSSSSVTSDLTMSWTESDGATEYRVWINKNGAKQDVIALTVTNWTPDGVTGTPALDQDYFDADKYEIFVRAVGPYGNGPWTAGRAFRRNRDQQPHNTSTVTNFRPTFIWTPTRGATTYNVWLERDGTKFHSGFKGNITSWVSTVDLPFGNWRWFVQAWSNAVAGPWLNAATFTISNRTPVASTLLSPTGVVAAAGNQWLEWSNVEFAVWYNLRVDMGGSAYVNRWIKNNTSNQVNLVVGDYQWWVRTWNVDGYGPWSASRKFSVGKCRNSSPPNGDVVTNALPEIGWIGLPSATSYRIWAYRNGSTYTNFSTGTNDTIWIAPTAWPSGSYQWWVRMNTPTVSPWSAGTTFTVP